MLHPAAPTPPDAVDHSRPLSLRNGRSITADKMLQQLRHWGVAISLRDRQSITNQTSIVPVPAPVRTWECLRLVWAPSPAFQTDDMYHGIGDALVLPQCRRRAAQRLRVLEEPVQEIIDGLSTDGCIPVFTSAIMFAVSRSAKRLPAPVFGLLPGTLIAFDLWTGKPFSLRLT